MEKQTIKPNTTGTATGNSERGNARELTERSERSIRSQRSQRSQRSDATEVTTRNSRTDPISDEALDAEITILCDRLGRLPKLDEIIEAVGGCQRARVVAARKRVIPARASQTLNGLLTMPPAIEARHRALLQEWLQLARTDIEPWLTEALEDATQRVNDAEETAFEARQLCRQLEAECERLQENILQITDERDRRARKGDRLIASEARWRARAEAAEALLSTLNLKVPDAEPESTQRKGEHHA